MLIQFSVENYQSIKNKVCLDMRAMGSLREQKNSLIDEKFLPVAAIYGPNGGGKTTVLRALFTMCSFIVQSINSLERNGESKTPSLYPQPFLLDMESRNKPTIFELVLQIGTSTFRLYMECMHNKILVETLQEKKQKGKPSTIYERKGNTLLFGEELLRKLPKIPAIADEMPALSYIKHLFGVSPVKEVFAWLANCCLIDYGIPAIEEALKRAIVALKMDLKFQEAMKKLISYLNFGIEDFKFISDDSNTKQQQITTIHKIEERLYELDLQAESSGSQKIFYLLPIVILSLEKGSPIVVDELDAKLHPKMLERIIGLFTDKTNNPKGAQLIFTSHDLSTMNNKVFRRDEIWFAAKDEKESTQLYSLADIREEDGERIRPDAVYNKQYLEGRYGADPYFKNMTLWGNMDE